MFKFIIVVLCSIPIAFFYAYKTEVSYKKYQELTDLVYIYQMDKYCNASVEGKIVKEDDLKLHQFDIKDPGTYFINPFKGWNSRDFIKENKYNELIKHFKNRRKDEI